MKSDFQFKFGKTKKLTAVLGLVLDGSKLDGVVLKRTNGALQLLQSFSVTLSLDPLTAAPELVGREIRNQLDAAGVRERDCAVAVPLKWALTAHAELPPLPDADTASLLQLEAERGFPCDPATLRISDSRSVLTADKKNVLLAGIPTTQLAALEQILIAAKLKPASFALAISALQSPADETSNGVLAFAIGENQVSLQITAGGGVAALRAFEGAVENENGRRTLHADVVARETRITLGQLPAELRATVKRIRIFGAREVATQLADELELRFEPQGFSVEVVTAYAPDEFGVTLPVGATLSAAFSLAARALIPQKPAFEFLPPKPTLLELLAKRYSSGRLRTAGSIVAVVVLLIGGLFLFQQFQLWRLNSQWSKMSARVGELEKIQDNIRQYRPWYDDTFHSLTILHQLTLAFPETGVVTAKTIDIREDGSVSCSGNAQDNPSLLAMQAKLNRTTGVSDLHLTQVRGKAPMQFTFEFKYGGANAN